MILVNREAMMRTNNRAKRAALLSLVLIIKLILGQLPAIGQTRRGDARRRPPTTARTQQSSSVGATGEARAGANGDSIVLSSSAKDVKMAHAFVTGKLPDPLRKPPGTVDEMAATLAKQLSARDEGSAAALLTAIMTAGFGVRDRDGSVTQTVQPGQGLAFDAWEVAAMAKMYGESRAVQLTYLTDGLKSIPQLKQASLDTILLEGIRKHARGNQPLLRFWARFIVELGRQADEPYDILGGVESKDVRLDAVQAALILRRLVGDFYAFGQQGKQASNGFSQDDSRGVSARRAADEEHRKPLFTRAAMRREMSPQFVNVRATKSVTRAPQGSPCGSLGEGEAATILDAAATVITTGWGELLGLGGDGAAKYAAFLNIANIVLAYAKFIATYAALETEISVENPPLVRTKNAKPGERRQLAATVTMNTGDWEQINCFRTALNVATGLDFSLLKDGPLKDVEVNWHLDEGGAGDFYSNSTGVTGKKQIVGFAGDGPQIQSAGTYAGIPGKGGAAVGTLTRTKTDKEGKARIYLEGSPKIPYVAAPFVPVMKQAVIRTTIKMKGGDIKGDAVDIAGHVLGGFIGLGKGTGLGGLAGGMATFPLELLYRTDWASSGQLTVPVRDHEPCEGGWYGTMTTSTRHERHSVDYGATQETVIKRDSSYRFEANIKFEGARATVTMESEEFIASDIKGGGSRSTHQQKASAQYSGEVKASVSVSPGGRYDVGFELPRMVGTRQTSGSCERPAPYKCQQPIPTNKPWEFNDPRYMSTISGDVDPNKPNEINETRTWGEPGHLEHRVTVNLKRCM